MVEVANMHDIRANLVHDLRKPLIDSFRAVSVLQSRIVDQVQGDAPVVSILLLPQVEVRCEGVFLSCEHMDFMALRQTVAQGLAVHLRPGVVTHGITMDDFQDSHDDLSAIQAFSALSRNALTSLARPSSMKTAGFQPRRLPARSGFP